VENFDPNSDTNPAAVNVGALRQVVLASLNKTRPDNDQIPLVRMVGLCRTDTNYAFEDDKKFIKEEALTEPLITAVVRTITY
jgi:hypothetical protein